MKLITFYLIAQAGFLTQNGNLKYFCPAEQGRASFEIKLPKGTYQYINLDKSDTTKIAVTKDGVYKLGFYENHPSVTILKNNPF